MTLRRLALILAVLATLAEPAFAQTQPIRRAVADFPTCASPTDGVMVVVLDPTGASDCSTGGGTASPHPCVCDGGATTWTAISGGGGGVSDHGGLTGLLDDDHTQYALLAGRSGSTVFNDLGADVDFRVEGETDPNLLFVDASTDRVGIGTSTPQNTLTVGGDQVVRYGTSATSYGAVYASTNRLVLDSVQATGNALIDLSPLPGDGTGAATFRFHRFTSTTGARDAVWHRGDGTSGQRHVIGSSGVTFNESGEDLDFRVEGDTNPYLIVGDAGADSVALFGAGSFGSGVGVLSLANATTRPSTAPTDAVILSSEDAAAGAANLFAYNEAGQRVRLTGIDRRLTTAVTKTTDTTHAAVTGLSLPVEAGKTYAFEARLYFDADTTGGVKVSVYGSATATATITRVEIQGDGNPASTFASTLGIFGGTASDAGKASGMIHIHGTVTINAAGTIEPWWSQSAATGSSTLKVGSTFHLREIS